MATLKEIREGLALNLRTSINEIQATGYMMSDPTPPSAEIVPTRVEYDLAMARGLDRLSFIVRIFVSFTQDLGAQMKLDEYLAPSGARSVKVALESDVTLGGTVDDLHVTEQSGYQTWAREGHPFVLGADWMVEVYASQ